MGNEDNRMIDPEYRPSWYNRRLTIFGALIFSAIIISAATIGWLFYGLDITAPFSAVLISLVTMSTVIISVYVFNARIESIDLAGILKR